MRFDGNNLIFVILQFLCYFAVPPPKLFAYFNPIQLSVDPLTFLWLNAFALNLQRSVKMLSVEQSEPPYLDVKIEAIMFRIIVEALEAEALHDRQRDRPRALHLQASRILCANYRSLETGTKADLAKCLDTFQDASFFFNTEFPNAFADIPVVADKMVKHATGDDQRHLTSSSQDAEQQKSYQEFWPVMRKDLLWTEAKDIWYVNADPLWADFQGTPATAGRPIPFIDAFPVSLWLYKQEDLPESGPKPPPLPKRNKTPSGPKKLENAKMHLLVHISQLVSVQLNHYQFLFLMRLLETVSEITTFLTQDVKHILGEEDESSMALGLIAPQIDVSLLMPSMSQSRDRIGGDFSLQETEEANTSMYSMGEVEGLSTPRNLATPASMLSVESAPASPSRSTLPNANSVPNLPTGDRNKASTPIATPTIQLSTPKDSTAKKKNSLTSSLSNMMASLDSSMRTTTPNLKSSNVATPTSEEDLLSVRSDDSDADSECFVVINQATDEMRDNTLFTINSKRASPVEVAYEAIEELPASIQSKPSQVANPLPTAAPQSVDQSGTPREGVVN